MKKKKRLHLSGAEAKRGIYKSRIESLYDNAVFLDSPEEAEILLLPTEKDGILSKEQNDLLEKYSSKLEVSIFPGEPLLSGETEMLDKYFSPDSEVVKEDISYELEL